MSINKTMVTLFDIGTLTDVSDDDFLDIQELNPDWFNEMTTPNDGISSFDTNDTVTFIGTCSVSLSLKQRSDTSKFGVEV